MKKSILALLLLLFLLILTCVYQKTSVLYEENRDSTIDTATTSIATTPLSIIKKEVAEVKVKEREIEKRQRETEMTKTKVLSKPVAKQEIPTITTAPPAPVPVLAKKKDIEEIDALMQALKNREIAFQNRDKFELYIQRLIKQALDDRTIAISHMNNEELHLIELQKELLKTRDSAYEKIGQPNNPTSGE